MIVPFAQTVGIEYNSLESRSALHNHLGSLHAGALYTLAEDASGTYLLERFSDLKDDVIPLLREGSMKYKQQVFGSIHAKAFVESEVLEKFEERLKIKDRALIEVKIELFDEEDKVVAVGSFVWFVSNRR